jgi:hypothetical protein
MDPVGNANGVKRGVISYALLGQTQPFDLGRDFSPGASLGLQPVPSHVLH